jgi:hypothetical protein
VDERHALERSNLAMSFAEARPTILAMANRMSEWFATGGRVVDAIRASLAEEDDLRLDPRYLRLEAMVDEGNAFLASFYVLCQDMGVEVGPVPDSLGSSVSRRSIN